MLEVSLGLAYQQAAILIFTTREQLMNQVGDNSCSSVLQQLTSNKAGE